MIQIAIGLVFCFFSLVFANKADIERDSGWVRGNPHPWLGLSMLCMILFLLALITL